MTEWIDTRDKEPPKNKEILITYNNLVLSGIFLNGKFYYTPSCDHLIGHCTCEEQEGVTHWAYLPPPPSL